MQKQRLDNEKDFLRFKERMESDREVLFPNTGLRKPDSYPCILIYNLSRSNVCAGYYIFDNEYVYPNEFGNNEESKS